MVYVDTFGFVLHDHISLLERDNRRKSRVSDEL